MREIGVTIRTGVDPAIAAALKQAAAAAVAEWRATVGPAASVLEATR